MIRRISELFIGLIFLLGLSPLPVYAQENTAVPVDLSMQPQSGEAATARQARLETYKARVTERLSEAQQTRVSSRCQSAQKKITALQSTDSIRVESRIAAYEQVVEKAKAITVSLQVSGVDTSGLETVITDLETEKNDLVISLRDYIVILTDLGEIDCVPDVDSFQATLVLARSSRQEVRIQARELRIFITNDFKAALQLARANLVELKES